MGGQNADGGGVRSVSRPGRGSFSAKIPRFPGFETGYKRRLVHPVNAFIIRKSQTFFRNVRMLKKILTIPTEELGRWSRLAVFQLRLWRQCIRLLGKNRCGTQAAALSYHTLFGIVPLAIIMLMVFQSLPAYRDVGDNVRQFLYEQAHLSDIEYVVEADDTQKGLFGKSSGPPKTIKLTDQIDELTDGFIAKLDTGAITLFSGVFVVWAAIGLLGTIERSFNSIWHTPRGRNFVQRIVNYWALLTLGPLLLGLGFYANTHYLTQTHIQDGMMGYLRPMLPYMISVIALFFLYFVMPNAKVSARAAIWAAAVAAVVWTGAKCALGAYIRWFIPYQAIYGVMGLVPLAVMWIYVTWLIVLFGLQLTYATQHLKTLDAADIAQMKRRDECFIANDLTVMRIMTYIMEQFEIQKCPVAVQTVCERLEMPADFTEKVLDHLVTGGLLFRTSEPDAGYTPATGGGNISLATISDAVAKVSFAQDICETDDRLKQIVASQQGTLQQHTLTDILAGRQGRGEEAVTEQQDS